MSQVLPMEREKVKRLLPQRIANSNKSTYGKLLIIAGKKECAGCAILSAEAALRSGLGMVKVLSPKSNFTALMGAVPEALFSSETDPGAIEAGFSWADAVLIGPGLGTGKRAARLLGYVLESRGIPAVLDADAINLISLERKLRLLLKQKAGADPVILTPHLMEMSRFTGSPIDVIRRDMAGTAGRSAQDYQITVALKDARTVTASPDGRIWVNTTGNNGMSTAGSGDVLAGLTGSLLSQSMGAFEAASAAVYLHGLAGDIAAGKKGVRGMKAMDIAEAIPEALLQVEG